MKHLILIFILILGINGYTQNSLKKGYYIDNFDTKIDCFIYDFDWLNNPTEFKYKLPESDEVKKLSIKMVKEFGITGVSKYVRFDVDIDKSSKYLDEMDYNKNPTFHKEVLFLKTLIEGEANLYLYENNGLTRYFFNKNNEDVAQLVYKNYLTSEGQVAKNNMYRRQLWNNLKCPSISMNEISKINYRKNELINFFIKYNECSGTEFVDYNEKIKRDLFNLSIRPGVRSSSLLIGNQNSRKEFDFEKGITSFRVGLEAEFVLGFNNNKWALLLEPTYHNFKEEKTFTTNFTSDEEFYIDVNRTSIDVNLGIRYYVYNNKNLNVFVNALGALNKSFNSSITITSSIEGKSEEKLDITSGGSAAIGIGCKHKKGYSAEFRYLPNYNILNGLGAWGAESRSLSLIFGYSFF